MSTPRPGRPTRRSVGSLAILPILLLVGCDSDEPQKAAPALPKVEVADVTVGDVPVTYDYAGTVKSVRLVEIVPRVSGEVIERPFVEGALVQEGDVLYQIDHRPFEAQIDNNMALRDQATAEVGFWTAEVDRYTQASRSGAVSKQEVNSAKTQLQNAQAQVKQYDAEIREAQLNLEYSTIKAPLKGRILQSTLYEGSIASAFESEPTSVIQLDPIHVVFNISRDQTVEIRGLMDEGVAGSRPFEDFVVEVFDSNGNPFEHKGKIDFFSFLINETTDAATIRAVFDNPVDEQGGTWLIPGQYVPVELTVGARRNQVLIPGPAVMEGEAGTTVYVYDASTKEVSTRKITTAGLHDQGWVVTDGLEAGEAVITLGQLKVRPGMKVDAVTAPTAGAGEGGAAGSTSSSGAGTGSGSAQSAAADGGRDADKETAQQ